MGGLGTAICQSLANDGMTVLANRLPGFPEKDGWLAKQKELGFDFIAAEGDVRITTRVPPWLRRSRPKSVRSMCS